MFRWFMRSRFGPGVQWLDAYSVAPFERHLFEQIVGMHFRNVEFLSLKLQLRKWLKVGTVPDLLDWPKWFRRRQTEDSYLVRPERPIGSEYGTEGGTTGRRRFRFELHRAGLPVGILDFRGCIVEFQIRVTPMDRKTYPAELDLSVSTSDFDDQTEYWENRLAEFPEFALLTEIVLRAINEGTVQRNIVFPASNGAPNPEVDGIRAGPAYARLLKYADGLCVNDIIVRSTRSGPLEIWRSESARLAQIGSNDGHRLYVPIVADRMDDSIHELDTETDWKLSKTNLNIVDVCLAALR